jgi:hypothetical protein
VGAGVAKEARFANNLATGLVIKYQLKRVKNKNKIET